MSNQFAGGLSRMKRFQILLWIIIVFTFLHLRRNLPTAISPPQIEKKNNSNNSIKTAPTITATTAVAADVTTSSPPTSSPLMKPTSTTTTRPTASDKLSIDSSTALTTDVETIIVEEEEEEEDKYQKPTIVNSNNSDSEKQQPTTITSQPSSSSIIQVPQIINSEESLIDNKPSKKDENEDVNAIVKTETASIAPIILTKKSSSSSSSTLPKVRTDNDLTPIERKFADTHCDLTHLKNNQWYPSSSSSLSSLSEEDNDDDDDSWQQRAPYIIVAGVWNAGINPIANALFKHPQIDKAKTNGFFLPKQFQRYYDVSSNNNDVNNININNNNNTEIASSSSSFNIKVFAARERMYAQVYSKSTLREKGVNDKESKDMTGDNGEDNNDDNKNNHVAMDVSPGLIFYAHKTAHSILCTVPWVKVVIILRNPIDRLYQQWSYSTTNLGLRLSLEDWMAQEMKLLHTVGLIGAVNNNKNNNNKDDKESVLTVVSEKEAWDKYQSVRNVAGAIGRSLYVLQLEEWINAYIAAGKNPSDFITILTTENIEDQPQKEYNKLIQFLHLAPIVDNNDDKNNIASTLLEKSFNKTKNNVNNNDLTPPMKEETRNMLRHFFQPYNQRLTKLLRSNGFEGNWDERWK
jgi:hypothetical protein